MQVMGGNDHGHAHVVEALEQAHDVEREVGIQVAGGFVRDQEARFADHGARDAHALLLAGGQLQRQALFLAQQSHLIERGAHAFVDFPFGRPR
jgi:hypothetical protein